MWLGLLYTETKAAKENGKGAERKAAGGGSCVEEAAPPAPLAPDSPGEMARQEPTSAYPMGHTYSQHGPPWPVLVLLTSALLHVFHCADDQGAGDAWRKQVQLTWSS